MNRGGIGSWLIAIAQLDTTTDNRLGQGAWGLGPTAVAAHLGKTWVYGSFINDVWSVSTEEVRGSVNKMLLEPFFTCNFPESPGRYLVFDPVITADWEADSDQRWAVPFGIEQIMRFISKVGSQIMFLTSKHLLIAVAIAAAMGFTSARAQDTTPDGVKTRIGDLNFERGYPTEATKHKVFDEIDYQRAVQAYLWAYPAVSFESIRTGALAQGIDLNVVGIADKFADAKGLWLTANDTTIYAFANVDLGKHGPVVVDIPPGAIVGLIDDFWQRSITDLGLPGPDGDKGGKFLLLPPGYTGEVPQSGYHVLKTTLNNYNVMVRGILVNNDLAGTVERVRKLRIYPWSEQANPKPTKFVSFSGMTMNTLPPLGMGYWERLSTFINNNPVQERDRFYMAMLKPLGIEKGKPFKPDARQRAILEDAARMGDAMGRVMLFDGPERFSNVTSFAGTKWHWVILVKATQETETYSQVDERLHYTYGAIYTSPGIGVMKAGPGSQYVQAFEDKDGNRLDGGKSYRLHIPANVPAAAFWSLTIYDSATRSMIQNPSGDAAHSSYDKLKVNADGSIDMYFGPKAPAGLESNWTETVPGKGFYPMMRFYSPKEGLFDGTWKLPDVELVGERK